MRAAGNPPVRVFVYGTLKRGGRYHAYCRGSRMSAGAVVEGLLYDLPLGYPAIVVPEETVLAVGTGDPAADARLEKGLAREDLREPGEPAVYGELYTFDDPEARFPALDALEGFVPGDPTSPYRRVLIPVRQAGGEVTPAWAYAWAYAARYPLGTHLPGGRWPA